MTTSNTINSKLEKQMMLNQSEIFNNIIFISNNPSAILRVYKQFNQPMKTKRQSQATGDCTQLLLIWSYPQHMQQHKCPIQGKTQKLFPNVHCDYRNPQTKLRVDIYKSGWTHFRTHKPGVPFEKPKLY